MRVLDFTPLVPRSIKRGVRVVAEADSNKELALSTCLSCEMENPEL